MNLFFGGIKKSGDFAVDFPLAEPRAECPLRLVTTQYPLLVFRIFMVPSANTGNREKTREVACKVMGWKAQRGREKK